MADLLDRFRAELSDRYAIERQIGRGGMATVYVARDLKLKREVALKVLRPELAASIWTDRFLRETEITANLSHPHILPLLDRGEVAGTLYYSMPYVEGESLQDRLLREGPLDLEEVLSITRDVAEALDFAHRRGVIHRDIKPGNILLEEGGSARVADFGIALAVSSAGGERLTKHWLKVGTPEYMSPEQYGGREALDGRSDLYSLACVVYEMLKGDPPFTGSTPDAVCARHARENPPPIRSVRGRVPARVEKVVLRALEKVPADRYKTPVVFATELDRAASRTVPSSLHVAAAAAVLLIAAVAVIPRLTGWMGWDTGPEWFPRTEIAVRFSQSGPSTEDSWFTDALVSDITYALNQGEGLGVRSAYALAAFPTTYALSDAARIMQIGTVVEGRVTYGDEAVIVDASLVDTRTSRILGEVIRDSVARGEERALLYRIAESVASRLRQELGVQIRLDRWRREARSRSVWEAVRRAQTMRDEALRQAQRTDNVPVALALLTEADSLLAGAEAEDPEWGEPTLQRAGIAFDRVRVVEVDDVALAVDTADVMRWIESGLGLVNRVIDNARFRARALELRGKLNYHMWRWTREELPRAVLDDLIADLRAAVEIDDRLAGAWVGLGAVLQQVGRFDEAHAATRKALEVDTWHEEVQFARVRAVFAALREGDIDQARTHCGFGRRHYPRDPLFAGCQLDILGRTGDTREAVDRAWNLALELDRYRGIGEIDKRWQYYRMLIAAIASRAGMADSARAILRAADHGLDGRGPSRHWLAQRAYVSLLLGDTTLTLQLLAEYLDAEPQQRQRMRDHPWFGPIRSHPDFLNLTALR